MLEWTCIGNPELQADRAQANLTFLVKDSHKLSNLVRRFWEIEEPKEIQIVKLPRDTVTETLSFEDGRHGIGLP